MSMVGMTASSGRCSVAVVVPGGRSGVILQQYGGSRLLKNLGVRIVGQGRRWQGRRAKDSTSESEPEDAAQRRHLAGEPCATGSSAAC
jgi:hypothetical protein